MAQSTGVNVPSGFGGLMRYSEEYESFINLKPTHVVVLIIVIIGLRVLLPVVF